MLTSGFRYALIRCVRRATRSNPLRGLQTRSLGRPNLAGFMNVTVIAAGMFTA